MRPVRPFDHSASSAVEFALIAPVFILMLCGILAYGVYFGAAHSVQQLAADAARASVAGLDDAERRAIALDYVAASAASYPLLNAARVTAGAGPLAADPDLFKVAVRYDAHGLGIWALGGLVPLPSRNIERTAVVRNGGF